MTQQARVLFVCLGNICRSPTAEGVFRYLIERDGLEAHFLVDSCGTGGWHSGAPPDSRMQSHAIKRGFDLSSLRARKLAFGDFDKFDWILAMDRENLAEIEQMAPKDTKAKIHLMGDFSNEANSPDVPDPYYGGAAGFERVLDLLEESCDALLSEIKKDFS